MEQQTTKRTLTRFPLQEAQRCIIAYKAAVRNRQVPEGNIIKAYLLQTQDIFEALDIQMTGGDSCTFSMSNPQVRVYIGMYAGSDGESNTYKLFLVPVNAEGFDVIPTGKLNDGDHTEVQYVYDFNTPCPKTCDTTSPLFQAGEK